VLMPSESLLSSAQDETLQAYLDQMSELLTNYRIGHGEPGGPLSVVASARTLTVLPRLDGRRKRSVLQFLYESGVINATEAGFSLSGADLRKANLSWSNLRAANLRRTDLRGANLSVTNLHAIDLGGANLREAKLGGADLGRFKLSAAELIGTDLSETGIRGRDLSRTLWLATSLANATVTNEQLAECKSLQDAIMPNGRKYEDWLETPEGQDWLKYKNSRGEDEENTRPS
jgi:Pentapeptide repeats (8 copies)